MECDQNDSYKQMLDGDEDDAFMLAIDCWTNTRTFKTILAIRENYLLNVFLLIASKAWI